MEPREKNRFAVNVLINALGGVGTFFVVELLRRLHFENLYLNLAGAGLMVLSLLVFAAVRMAPSRWVWITAPAIVAATVLVLWFTAVRVPNVVGLPLAEGREAVAKAGLESVDIEMERGGAPEITLQRPEAGTRLLRNSSVRLYFGGMPSVRLVSPTNGALIRGHRGTVAGNSQGVLGSKDFRIYILIQAADNHFWVQDPPTMQPLGDFSVLAYFGEANIGRGENYQVQAIVTTEKLKLGDIGTEMPRFVACTPIVRVSRSP